MEFSARFASSTKQNTERRMTMNYLKNCMYNKIAAYFHEHNDATSEEIWDKVFNFSGSLKIVERTYKKVVDDTIDDLFDSMSA